MTTVSNKPEPSQPDQRKATNWSLIFWVILLTAVLTAMLKTAMKRRDEADQRGGLARSQIAVFQTAIDLFDVDIGHYPHSLPQLIELPAGETNWHGPYLAELPKDPWGHAYVYSSPGVRHPEAFDLTSLGADGKLGTADDYIERFGR